MVVFFFALLCGGPGDIVPGLSRAVEHAGWVGAAFVRAVARSAFLALSYNGARVLCYVTKLTLTTAAALQACGQASRPRTHGTGHHGLGTWLRDSGTGRSSSNQKVNTTVWTVAAGIWWFACVH